MITDDDILLMFRMTGSETDSPEAMERSRVGSVCTPGVSEGQCLKRISFPIIKINSLKFITASVGAASRRLCPYPSSPQWPPCSPASPSLPPASQLWPLFSSANTGSSPISKCLHLNVARVNIVNVQESKWAQCQCYMRTMLHNSPFSWPVPAAPGCSW